MQPDIELAFHDDRDHVAGPHPEVELQLPWILVRQDVSQPRQLVVAQRGGPAGHRLGLQHVPAAPLKPGPPSMHRTTMQAKRFCDLGRRRTRHDQIHRSHSQHLERDVVEFPTIVVAHSNKPTQNISEDRAPLLACRLIYARISKWPASDPLASWIGPVYIEIARLFI
ncbi:MAG TPA: hypothetical protein VEF72_30130 [Mycobacterium sp.]|nr:hypothetical protein [Mycobacterium sp.]